LFIFLDVHRPWRKVKVTDSRAAVDRAGPGNLNSAIGGVSA
jgi:hypothetical protein